MPANEGSALDASRSESAATCGGATHARLRTSRWANTCCVEPQAITRPFAMTASEVAKSLTTSMSWHTITTAAPARARSRTVSITVMHSR